jgi:single-strand DNA-binding protein
MSATVTVTGNLTHDPTSRTTAQGHFVTTFRMATTARRRTPAGEWVDGATTYYKVTCWRGKGERAARCLRRGDAVIVHGRQEQKEWTDRSGQVRTDIEIEAEAFGPDLARVVATVERRSSEPAASAEVDPWTGEATAA